MKKIIILLILMTTGLQAQTYEFDCEEVTSIMGEAQVAYLSGVKRIARGHFYSNKLEEVLVLEVDVPSNMEIFKSYSAQSFSESFVLGYEERRLAVTPGDRVVTIEVRIKDPSAGLPEIEWGGFFTAFAFTRFK